MKLKVISGRWGKKHYHYLIVCMAITLTLLLTGLIYYTLALDWVELAVDGRKYRWKTLNPTVSKALREKKVILNQGDEVRPALSSSIQENTKIEVIRAFKIQIIAGGKTTEFNTIARPVKEVLAKAKVKFDRNDIIKPGLETLVKADEKIKIVKVRSEIITKQVAINPETEYRSDKSMERGLRKTIRSGRPGLAEYQIKMTYHDDVLAQQTTLFQKTLKAPVNEVIVVGTKPMARTLVTSRGSYRYIEAKEMVATAYYPGPESCGKYADGYTYSGKKAGYGVVAVDPRVIHLGTQLYIEGYGKAEAADIGSAIKGNKIDLCYETYKEALSFGRKKIRVYILE